MKNIPDRIYLQIGSQEECNHEPDDDFNELAEVSWCVNKIYDNDIEYVRADKIIDIVKNLKYMIHKAKSPMMDGSHNFDFKKADKLLNKIYNEVIKMNPCP